MCPVGVLCEGSLASSVCPFDACSPSTVAIDDRVCDAGVTSCAGREAPCMEEPMFIHRNAGELNSPVCVASNHVLAPGNYSILQSNMVN